tara:strand:- start:320 stop:1969 length:1650 start_codon:yes stop_codon:yes gene_type:complete
MLIRSNNFLKTLVLVFYLVYLILGLLIHKDFGITTDEEFQRYSGFYWLQYILNFTPFENLKYLVSEKLLAIDGFTLPNPKDFPFYGVIFDAPLALLETLLKIEDSQSYFYLRHKINFIIFFVSSVYLYKLLKNRFGENYLIILGVLLYIFSPRIFGDSFFNNKDIIFLSLVTISIYYYFNLVDNFNYKNIILFGIIGAIATSARVIGIFLPISYILIKLFETLDKKINFEFWLKIVVLLITYFVVLTMLWPYLWSNPLTNFVNAFLIFSNYIIDINFLFNGDYISSKNLPLIYLPLWILISNPVFTIIFFLLGYILLFKKFLKNLFKIERGGNIWNSEDEEKDFFIFINFTLIFSYLILSNAVLYNGWRQIYFLHIFITYFAFYGIKSIFFYFKVLQKFKNYVSFIFFLTITLSILKIYQLHPFQSFYFNSLVSKKNIHNKFEIDYWGLSGKNFFERLIKLQKKDEKVKIAVASWMPLERSIAILSVEDRKKIQTFGQDYFKADYIFLNNTSEVNKKYDNKYSIPKNFNKFDELVVNKTLIYEIFKKVD